MTLQPAAVSGTDLSRHTLFRGAKMLDVKILGTEYVQIRSIAPALKYGGLAPIENAAERGHHVALRTAHMIGWKKKNNSKAMNK